MYKSDQTITVAIKPCACCGASMIAESNFCRSCGAAQRRPTTDSSAVIPGVEPDRTPRKDYVTARLSQQKLYHPVSGPLVSAVAEGVPPNSLRSPTTGFSKRMLLALMAVPIWLMIILLSPLDAYASAKIIGNRI